MRGPKIDAAVTRRLLFAAFSSEAYNSIDRQREPSPTRAASTCQIEIVYFSPRFADDESLPSVVVRSKEIINKRVLRERGPGNDNTARIMVRGRKSTEHARQSPRYVNCNSVTLISAQRDFSCVHVQTSCSCFQNQRASSESYERSL